jgi:hypothetical protein
MAFAYIQEAVVLGNPNDLRKLFPFWHQNARMAEKISRIWLSSAMNYATPMKFKEISKDYPGLIFIWWKMNDANGWKTIHIISDNKYKVIYDEKLQHELEEDYMDFSEQTGVIEKFVPEKFEIVWEQYVRLDFNELKSYITENGHCFE